MERDEPLSNEAFDAIAAVMDWLGACAEGRLDDLLDMYDENATSNADAMVHTSIVAGPYSVDIGPAVSRI